jgi:TetR/AcrR family transcriptional regulator, mexJK operon transcriptional repressor
MSEEDPSVLTRPRLEARRRAFLEAATAAFLEKGYAATTLDDIIARSGGSRQTLYALFGGKQGLFKALVAERCTKIFAPLCGQDLLDRAPDDVLVDLGIRFIETVTTPDTLGVYRLVVSEGIFMKELAEQFWENGPARTRAMLARYFEQQVGRGTLRLDDPEQAAHQFWGMLLGNFQFQCLLGLREAPGPEETEAFVRAAVSRFLDGCRVGGRTP